MTPPRVFTLRAMGRRVQVRAETGVPEPFLDRLLASWADCLDPGPAQPGQAPDVLVHLEPSDAAASDPSLGAADGAVAPGQPETARLVVGPEPTWPGAEQSFTTLVTTALLSVLVGRAHLLHAAALTPPAGVDGGAGAALVLVGPSGRGKTTAARALAQAGWGYLSDETAVIDPASGTVIPYPKPLSLIEEAGRPKVQRAAGALGMSVPPRGAPLGALVLLRRLGPEEEPQASVPRVESVPLAEGLQALVEQSSGLERMPDGAERLARLVHGAGGVRRVLYREASTLDPVLRELARDPDPTAVREPWTRVAEESETAPSGRPGRWRRAPGTHGIDTEQAALVLRPGHSYVLTRAAADAWLLLEGAGRTPTDLRRTLEGRHGPAPDGAVEAILTTLAEEGLVRAPARAADSAPGSSAGDPGRPPGTRPHPRSEAPSPVEEEPAP